MKKRTNSIIFHNLYWVIGVILFFFLIIHLIYISLSKTVDGVNLKEFASNRTTQKNFITASRGSIIDRNGDVIAQNISTYNILCYLDKAKNRSKDKNKPMYVVDKVLTAEKLAPILNMTKEEILTYLNKDKYVTELGTNGRNLSEIKKDQILSLNLPGIEFEEKETRYYPYGDFLSYTIGYAKEVESKKNVGQRTLVGELGIEKYYNEELSGSDGYTEYQKDRKGYKIPNTKEINVPAKRGKDIKLTIDSTIQLFVDQAILHEKNKNNAQFEWLSMIVANAKTGEILAMSQYPSFDPNKRNITNYLDYNISYPFEPGSTMKTYTFLTAMKKGIYNGNDTFLSGSYVTKDETKISDWKKEGWGYITYDKGYALSANTSVINLLKKGISGEELRQSFKDFGFGSKTGIRLANEASGKLNFKYETEVLNASFGQNVTTTPIQQIQALTSIANNGYILKPYIIKSIYDPNTKQNVFTGKKEVLRKVMDKEDAEKMRELMDKVVSSPPGESAGRGFNYPEYSLIGKTGTAQIYNGKNGYYADTYIKSFAGMFPKNNPEIVLYIASRGPGINSTYLANIVKDVVKNISEYMNYKEKVNEKETFVIPNFYNKDKEEVEEYLKTNKLRYMILGNGKKIVDYYPSSNYEITKKDLIVLKTNDTNIAVPNLSKLSLREVQIILDMLHIKYEFIGNGYYKSSVMKDGKLIVNFEAIAS